MPLPTLCIAEYECFGLEEIESALKSAQIDSGKIKGKAAKILADLESFAKIEGNECFLGFNRKKLRAKNYVGVIQTRSGFCVEILPKTFKGSGFKELQGGDNQTKECTCGEKISPMQFNKADFKKQVESLVCSVVPCHSERSEESIETYKRDVSPVAQHDKGINALSQYDERAGAVTQHTKTLCPLCHINQAKQILLNCLKTLKNSPFKKSNIATLQAQNLPLLEAFAAMFLDECESLTQRGLKSDYIAIAKNRAFLKGRLELNAHISHNLAHKERFFTTSDEYIADIAPNRLIKSTLLLLSTLNFSAKTRARLHSMRFIFDDIESSKNLESDFAKCENMSRLKEYENLLLWCRLFLQNKAFSPYSGTDRAFALLYPMERLFESFVAHWLKVCKSEHGFSVATQESRKYFMRDFGSDLFCLRPDIVLRGGGDSGRIIIADTKWKLLDSKDTKYGISQNDLYQMWAYLSKYGVELDLKFSESSTPLLSAWLIYPLCESASDLKAKNLTLHFKASEIFTHCKEVDSHIVLHIAFFPLTTCQAKP